MREVLKHRLKGELFTDTRLLDAAIRDIGSGDLVLIDLHQPCLESCGGIHRHFQVTRPYRRRKSEFGIICQSQGLFIFLELDDASDRPEYLLLRDNAGIQYPGNDRRLQVVAVFQRRVGRKRGTSVQRTIFIALSQRNV